MDAETYEKELRSLQLALVDWQAQAMGSDQKVCIVLEGRDASGKDGMIRAITAHLSNRFTRIVALPKPSDRQQSQWFFQRYVVHLPAAGEFVIFNRSWYNRAGVERVMGFSTKSEQEDFLRDAPTFERMLEESGMVLLKYWLDIDKRVQGRRLDERRTDPIKALKVSPLDAVAQKKWKAYSNARNDMLERTSSDWAPWWCVRADHKKRARINLIRHLVRRIAGEDAAPAPDPDILFRFEPAAIADGRLAP